MIWSNAFLDGIIVSFVICGWISFILKVNPRFEMKSFPPEIVKCVEPQTRQEKKSFLLMALPVLLATVAYLIISVYQTYSLLDVSFPIIVLHLFVILMVWNVFDLVIFDWLVFCKLNPEFMTLPNTKGHRAYKDYYYHFQGFLKGTAMSVISSLLIASIVWLLKLM